MKSTSTAVITINVGDALATMASMTIPTFKAYADRICADFVIIDTIPEHYEFPDYSAYWAKFIIKDYLAHYDRVIYLDLDTIILAHCPNLFEVVPRDMFAALVEDDFGNDLSEEILDIQNRLGDLNWRRGYFNVGVMVMSREHRDIFSLEKGVQGGAKYPEQTLMNYNLRKYGIPLFKLSHRFNHMRFLNVSNADRHLSYIWHYAGIPQRLREAMMEEDLNRFSKGRPLFDEYELEDFILNRFPGEDLTEFQDYELFRDKETFSH